MESNELVSIIIPCYNHADHLEETVQSVLNQTYKNIEIIIIDDGSTDNTEKIALILQKKYPDFIHLLSQENTGVSQARNNGIKIASGQFILPVDADDILHKNMIYSCLKTMIENDADIVYTDIQCFGIKNFIVKKSFSKDTILYQNLCSVSSLYRRKVWDITGGYKKNMQEGYEDWEFWINAFKHGFIFKSHPEILLMYRTKKESRDTLAEQQDTYIKAKIVMNHPALYPILRVQEAITIIRKTEELADLYFYHDKNMLDNEKIYIIEAVHYISSNPSKKKQMIQVHDLKVGLCSLDILKNSMSLEKLYKKMDVDFLLFYAPMRYELETLRNSSFAWKKGEGVIKAHGTLFHFVYKSERENPKRQLITYQRLLQYQAKILTNKEALIEKKDALLKQEKVLIENQNQTIADEENLLQKKLKEIDQNNNKMETLMNAIQQVTKFSITKNPIHKYEAYKIILNTYYKFKKS